METITIAKKEYNTLVFAKRFNLKNRLKKTEDIWDKSFGALKKSFGKGSSVSFVKKMRKSWR